jgi:hypothetical protein
MRSLTQTLTATWRWAVPAGLTTVLVLAGPLLAACQTPAPALTVATTPSADAGATSDNEQATVVLSRIRAEIGAARCDSTAQCRTLAIGEKACGGPEAWLAWSTASSDAARLAALSAESVAQARQDNARSGMASDCRYNADPGAQCVAGACRLRSPNLAI